MKLSVITVSYNDIDGLVSTLNSVRSQTFIQNIEHIVVDGGSGYNVISIPNLYPHIASFVSEADDGIYDAMNKGIKIASGEYLIFLNGGDVFVDEFVVEAFFAAVNESYPDFVYGDSLEKSFEGGLNYKFARSIDYLWYGMFTHHQSMFFKSVIAKDVMYLKDIKIGADYNFVCRFLAVASSNLKLSNAVCIFSVGGASYIQWWQGMHDNWNTRSQVLGVGLLANSSIFAVHIVANLLRRNLAFIYNRLRYINRN